MSIRFISLAPTLFSMVAISLVSWITPASAQGAIKSFQTMFETGCVAAKVAGNTANVAGLTRLERKDERFWLDGERGQVWVTNANADVPSPRLLALTKGTPAGCRVVARNISEQQLANYLRSWDKRNAAFVEDKAAFEKGPETTVWMFSGAAIDGADLVVLAVSVPFLKSASVTVARLEEL